MDEMQKNVSAGASTNTASTPCLRMTSPDAPGTVSKHCWSRLSCVGLHNEKVSGLVLEQREHGASETGAGADA
jgi:hypothetical protein